MGYMNNIAEINKRHIRMIIVSKYDLQETIARLQNSICSAEQYKPFMNSDLFQNYWGTVSDDRFRLQKGLGQSI